MIWTNTSLFDSLLPEKDVTDIPNKATSIILGAPPIDIKLFPNVNFVFRAGVGTDNVNFPSNIKVEFPSTKTKNFIYEETANFTCSLIFKMLYDGIGDLTSWDSVRRNVLSDKTLLIVGLGNIGQRVQYKMSPFIKNILTYDILNDYTPPDYSKADIVTLHIPYTPQNKSFINKENLKRFKSDAILINTARGPLVNEDDLYHHLKTTNMRAAFDAFWVEPYTGKLTEFKSDKFLMTPHIASSSIEFIESCYEDFIYYYER
jgi:D-3-phosphoglycerate dehydrogenase